MMRIHLDHVTPKGGVDSEGGRRLRRGPGGLIDHVIRGGGFVDEG